MVSTLSEELRAIAVFMQKLNSWGDEGETVARAADEIERLEGEKAAVLAIHKPKRGRTFGGQNYVMCVGCSYSNYPCPTAAALGVKGETR